MTTMKLQDMKWDNKCQDCFMEIKEINGVYTIIKQDVDKLYKVGKKYGKNQIKCSMTGNNHKFKGREDTGKSHIYSIA